MDPAEAGVEAIASGELASVGGAAFGAPGEKDSESGQLQPRFDALSLLETPKEEEPEPTAEDIFELLQDQPTAEDTESSQPYRKR